MSRTFIASVLAASLAVTSFTAAPAAAGNDNLEKFLLGAGTLLIIGSALNHHKSKVIVTDRSRDRAHRYGGGYRNKDDKGRKRRISKLLPRYCLTRVETRRGDVRMFGARCLNRNYRHADWLPRECKIRVKGKRHIRTGYKPRCLRNYGYRVARG